MAGEACAACNRPAQFRKPMWYRTRAGELRFAGWYGRACFYRVARAYARDGFTVQHDASGRRVAWRTGGAR